MQDLHADLSMGYQTIRVFIYIYIYIYYKCVYATQLIYIYSTHIKWKRVAANLHLLLYIVGIYVYRNAVIKSTIFFNRYILYYT